MAIAQTSGGISWFGLGSLEKDRELFPVKPWSELDIGLGNRLKVDKFIIYLWARQGLYSAAALVRPKLCFWMNIPQRWTPRLVKMVMELKKDRGKP